MWLGGITAIVGSLMGTVFGMVMPWTGGTILGSVPDTYILNQNTMMYLSVVLGLIQIVFGKFIAGYKTQIQKRFIAEVDAVLPVGSIDPDDVVTPGVFVDALVLKGDGFYASRT